MAERPKPGEKHKARRKILPEIPELYPHQEVFKKRVKGFFGIKSDSTKTPTKK